MKRKRASTDRSTSLFIKVRTIILIIFIFVVVHLYYMYTVSHHHFKDNYTIPDTLMLYPNLKSRKFITKAEKEKNSSELGINAIEMAQQVQCKPKKNFFFLKTHKTGSTTMTNVFLRYAEKMKYVVGLPPTRKWQLAGYPTFFNSSLIDPQLEQYNVLCHHTRFSKLEVSRVMPPDTVYITILRETANLFESAFSFFSDFPFPEWMPDYRNPAALEKFLESPRKYYNKSTPWHFVAKNYQAFDLGFDHEREDSKYVEEVINEINSQFHLVMITDRFEESLILLKDLLCMESIEDLIYLRLKVRKNSSRRVISKKMEDQMREWNWLDTQIHNYYLKQLDNKIEQYGREKMNLEVQQFNKLLKETEKRCVLEYDHNDLRTRVSRIRLNKNAGELCEKLSWGEVQYGDYIRNKQKSYANINMDKQISMEEMKKRLDEEQNKILHIA